MKVIAVGDVSVQESHESGAITVAEYTTKTVVKRGLYADLLELLPQKGAAWGVSGEGESAEPVWWVAQAQLSPGPGGTGTLTVTLSDSQESAHDIWGVDTAYDIIEVNWAQIEKPIMANKKIMKEAEGALLQATIDEVEAWRNSPQQRRRLYQVPRDDLKREPVANDNNDWVSLEGAAKDVAQKIAAGTESYLVFSPVVSVTRILTEAPTLGGVGVIDTPSVSIGLPTNNGKPFVYLKMADEMSRQADGTFRHVQQWQGADAWDTDLYPGGASA